MIISTAVDFGTLAPETILSKESHLKYVLELGSAHLVAWKTLVWFWFCNNLVTQLALISTKSSCSDMCLLLKITEFIVHSD